MKNSTASTILTRFVEKLKACNCSRYGFALNNPIVEGMKSSTGPNTVNKFRFVVTSDFKILPQTCFSMSTYQWEEAPAIAITPETEFNNDGMLELINDLPTDLVGYLKSIFED
ncbi:MAG: hypothetical protein AAF391_07555 [Bacteroidota bacterium]